MLKKANWLGALLLAGGLLSGCASPTEPAPPYVPRICQINCVPAGCVLTPTTRGLILDCPPGVIK